MIKILTLGCLLFFFAGCTMINSSSSLAYVLYNHEYVLEVDSVALERYLPHPVTGELIDTRQIVIYRIKYISDDYEVMGYIAAPADFMDVSYPILILNRGGHNKAGFGDWTVRPQYVGYFAFRGYIVLASQYRGGAGGTGTEQFGGDDINDVLNLINISESFYFAKQDGVFMYGSSRGGMMTYIAVRMDNRIKAAASWAGVSNLFDAFNKSSPGMQHMLARLIGGTPDEVPEEFERRSAVFWANEINVPLLIGHGGDSDRRVHTDHSINLAEILQQYERLHKLVIYPDIGHDIPIEFIDEMDEWFRKHSNFE